MKTRLLTLVLLVALLVTAVLAGCKSKEEQAMSLTFGTTNFGGSISVAEDITAGDDLTVTDDMTVDALTASGKLTVNDQALIDGDSDEVQLTAQGYTTQTNHILVVETTAGTDLFWVTNDGDVEMNGTTPVLTVGDAGAEDTTVLYDGNAQDFYIALDDSVDDLVLGLGSTVGTTPILALDENQKTTTGGDLTVAGATPLVTVGDAGEEDAAVVFDGAAQDFYVGLDDTVDDLVIGKGSALGTTQAIGIDENLLITTGGDVVMGGTTPLLTIGDAGEEDAAVVYDGNAQDFYIGVDDTVDDLVFGKGTALGTTQALGIDENLLCTFAGATQYNAGMTLGADGTSFDFIFYSDTAGDYMRWDESAEALVITGTAAATALSVADGNVAIDDDLDVNGTTNLDDADIDLTASLNIDGHMVDIGTGSCSVADADNDLCVAGDVEVDGELELDGALDADSTSNFAGVATFQSLLLVSFADETITDGELLTVTKTVYGLDSAGNVTVTLSTSGAAEGQFLILIGDDANNITIADTNIRTSTGAALVLGQYDVVMFVFQDSEWIELLILANS